MENKLCEDVRKEEEEHMKAKELNLGIRLVKSSN